MKAIKIRYIILLSLIYFASTSFAQIYTDKDSIVLRRTLTFGQNRLSTKPIGEVITAVGRSLLGTDYLAYGIEKEGEEQLVINLTGVDCTTFMESVLALSRTIKRGDTTFSGYAEELTLIRYRGGKIDRYPSRLHYFSDWIYDNEKKGIVEDITPASGGAPIMFNLNFMSEHPQYYKHLKDNPEFIPDIRAQEQAIYQRGYSYIPKLKVADVMDKINEGDIIAFTTSVEGLDIGHVGIAVKQGDKIHLMHAPDVGQKVQISTKPLDEYVRSVKKHTGIIIIRPLEPEIM